MNIAVEKGRQLEQRVASFFERHGYGVACNQILTASHPGRFVAGAIGAKRPATGLQLGNGTTTSLNVPVTVSGLTDAIDISAGGHTCAVLSDVTARCWGNNDGGMLGIGNSGGYSPLPLAVVGIP